MQRKLLLLLFINFIIFNTVAQEKRKYSRKGEFFGYWGYNRSEYNKSDIFFKGKGYEFTLHDVAATDRPTPFKAEVYFNVSELSIPQYNLRFGYFFNDHWSISIGTDHMKYIMVDDQLASITGHISAQVSDPVINVNPAYVGDYNHTPFTINSHDFLIYEHSDGFNYAHVELDRYDRLWKAKNNVQGIDWLVGVGFGPLVPRTDAHLFTVGNNHDFKIAGYGVSLKTGLRFDISKRFYLQTDVKGGFSRLSNVTTTGRSSDYAQQSIWFGEFYGVFGYKFGRHRAK